MTAIVKKTFAFQFILLIGLISAACSNVELAIPGVSKALFRDEFIPGHTGTWLLESDELGTAVIVPEQLMIELNAPNMVQYSMLSEHTFSDFSLEVDARLDGGSPSSTYGVLFRMNSPAEFYRFEISGDGMYIIERHDADGSWHRFAEDWQDTVAINQGLGAINRLKVLSKGSHIAVYVNDTLLEEVVDTGYQAGNIALDAGTFDAGGARVSFDNLVVSEVSP